MSEHKELLKHSRNYLIANIATKALAFISIPVYTRLMSVEEYGVLNVYISIIMIAPILLTLNTEVAVSRYYFDTDDIEDFKEFVGCSICISSIIFIFMTLISLAILPWIAKELSFSMVLTITIIPVSLYKVTNSIFSQIYNPLLESKKIAIVSSIQSYLAFLLSILAILMLQTEKYYGYVLGNIVAMVILGVYLYNQIKPYYKRSFRKVHIKYILNYCLPYLPYSLSGVIIAQFGKIFISNDSGFANAGLYSFASNIALVMMVFIGLVHQAWNPFYFRYMNEKDFRSVDMDYDLIWRVTLILGVMISLFSYEAGIVLGKMEYYNSLYIIPLLAMGYIFYQLAYVYMRNAGYAKKTIWNGLVVVLSGIVNVVLNALLIPQYKELGAATAFMFSYFFLFLLSWAVNSCIIKVHAPNIRQFVEPFVIMLPFIISCSFINQIKGSMVFFLLKIILFCVFVVLISFKYRNQYIKILNKFKNVN